MNDRDAVITSIARTPIGRFAGGLASLRAPELGAVVIAEALARARVAPADVDELYFGHVLSAGVGQAPARQAARLAGLASSVPCTAVNKVCGSGLKAAMLARALIRAGEADVIVAGGMESMSNAPYLMPAARRGFRMGAASAVDAMIADGLWDPFEDVHMGAFGDRFASAHGWTREAQDAYAKESYERARAAQAAGAFDAEIVPVEVRGPRGRATTVHRDEEPERFDPAKMSALPPAFTPGGTVTAANGSKIDDGAAALVAMSRVRAMRSEAPILATMVADATWSGEAADFPLAPAHAITRAAARAGVRVADIDLFEISEAFSVVPLAAIKTLGIDRDRVNVTGGAVSLGHPIGASGARLLVTLVAAMGRRGARRGCVTLCLGGGEAVAMIVETEGA